MLITNKPIILASKSPRRQELLGKLGLNFNVKTIEVDESFDSTLLPNKIAEQIALNKSKPFQIEDNSVLITADTVVSINNKILGKPKNYKEAYSMLTELSNNKHQVITGVCLKSKNSTKVFHESTDVYFNNLNSKEIKYYIEEFKPFDKAGSYGIQEWIGMIGIEKIEGCFYNVMGLPTQKLYSELQKFIADDM